MTALIGSLYLVSTLAFGAAASAAGLRLMTLARRTGKRPEMLLGLGLLLTAGLGYMVMMLAIVARPAVSPAYRPLVITLLAAGWIFHNVGVTCMLRFTASVFRPGDRAAERATRLLTAVLWTGWAAFVWEGGLADAQLRGGYWVAFAVIGTYPIWSGLESFAAWLRMRRRQALGLADPLVVERFLLWALASFCAAAAIWTVNVPTFAGVPPDGETLAPLAAVCMVATAAFGLATIGCYWLTFFPPAWYRARVRTGPRLAIPRRSPPHASSAEIA